MLLTPLNAQGYIKTLLLFAPVLLRLVFCSLAISVQANSHHQFLDKNEYLKKSVRHILSATLCSSGIASAYLQQTDFVSYSSFAFGLSC